MSRTMVWLERLCFEAGHLCTGLHLPKDILSQVCSRLHACRRKIDDHLIQEAAEDALFVVQSKADRFDSQRGRVEDLVFGVAFRLLANDLRGERRRHKHETPVGDSTALERLEKKTIADTLISASPDNKSIDEASAPYLRLRLSLPEQDRPQLDLLVRGGSMVDWARLLGLEGRSDDQKRKQIYATKRGLRDKVTRRWKRLVD